MPQNNIINSTSFPIPKSHIKHPNIKHPKYMYIYIYIRSIVFPVRASPWTQSPLGVPPSASPVFVQQSRTRGVYPFTFTFLSVSGKHTTHSYIYTIPYKTKPNGCPFNLQLLYHIFIYTYMYLQRKAKCLKPEFLQPDLNTAKHVLMLFRFNIIL